MDASRSPKLRTVESRVYRQLVDEARPAATLQPEARERVKMINRLATGAVKAGNLRPMSEAPTAACQNEFLVRVEYDDGTKRWLCVIPIGNGDWQICGTDHILYPEGWVIVSAADDPEMITVLGWIPTPEVTP